MEGQEFSKEFREGGGADTRAPGKASKEVVEIGKVDRRRTGVDDVASFIASILHHGTKKKGTLGGTLVEEEKVQQRGLSLLEFEEVG